MESSMSIPKVSIEHWYPIFQEAGVQQPKTELVRYEPDGEDDAILSIIDGKLPRRWQEFDGKLRAAYHELADDRGRAFLRHAVFSGKHEWANTCAEFQDGDLSMDSRVRSIIDMGECMMVMDGYPWDLWAMREYLAPGPYDLAFIAYEFHGMPVRREFRCFVRDGVSEAVFPYWPPDAFRTELERHQRVSLDEISRLDGDELQKVVSLAELAGKAIGGFWSIDILSTNRGWFVTDCAPGNQSWRWDEKELGPGNLLAKP